MLLRLLKNWALPLAMLTGALSYLIFTHIAALAPIKPYVREGVGYIIPWLIFAQLLLTFCKVESWSDLKPKPWHAWLLMFQLIITLGIVALLLRYPMFGVYRGMLEGVMVCVICPTATAAAVVTAKLGGSASSLTTYTLLSNLLAAITVPLVFPLVEPHAEMTFIIAFLHILGKVFPLLLLPFFLAWVLRAYFARAHQLLARFAYVAFYLWAMALIIVSGQTIRYMVNSEATFWEKNLIALAGLAVCCVQFLVGKNVGGRYADRISGGQSLGQKNTVLAIWMAYTYLNPLASLAPASYVLWQNIINSWQLWRKRKREERALL